MSDKQFAWLFRNIASRWNSVADSEPEGYQWSIASLRLVSKSAKLACNEFLLDRAAAMGSLRGMVKLSGVGFKPTDMTCRLAASQGHLECLAYAYNDLCAPLKDSLSIARSMHCINILEYGKKAGWPLP